MAASVRTSTENPHHPFRHPYRAATPADAEAMAELVNFAGEGLPLYLWTKMAEPEQSPWDVGRWRARRDSGAFSYRNTVVREDDGRVVAALIGYPLADEPDRSVYDDLPPMFVPLQQLEDLAAGTWYVNVLAAYPEYRGKGYGSELLRIAERLAECSQRNGLSIIVSDANTGARRLYERCGYTERARRGMVKDSWDNPGKKWVLLMKPR
ncbi:MAG: GNAT family N-acetyltransferase [Nitrococcus mobilis]|nr:GNAT family N-acetyltransferase [Nitrococcus mobilis]